MTTAEKAWIDAASYEDLLRRWRYLQTGSPWFTGETGLYYLEVMARLYAEDPGAHVRASIAIGWPPDVNGWPPDDE
jgi:hypothetical protein